MESNTPTRKRFLSQRQLLFAATSLIVLAVLWSARTALSPFLIGLATAYLIAPLVTRLHAWMPPRVRDRGFGRPLAIIVVYLSFLAVVGGLLLLVVPPLVAQANQLVNDPNLESRITRTFDDLTERYHQLERLRPAQAKQLEDTAASFVPRILTAVQDGLMATLGAIFSTVSWVLAMIIVPIWLFYILNDTGKVLNGAMGLIPRDLRPDVEAMRIIFDRVLGAYIRGQLIIALILGTLMTISLTLLGVEYALLLGVLNGILGFIPFIGSILGAIPAVGVALLGGPELAVKTLIVFIIIQQIDGALISPRVQGDSVALSPALIMVVLVIGQQMLGFLGLLIAVPLAAILRDTVHYLYLRVGEEDAQAPVAALTSVGYGESATALMTSGGDLVA